MTEPDGSEITCPMCFAATFLDGRMLAEEPVYTEQFVGNCRGCGALLVVTACAVVRD